ncbi:MAG: TRAP-type transport system periplasmic protein [Clostridiales bacterium]|nr:TRAP-type transport system periplasmic protein [Clostridiales bacterium]
MYNKSNQQIILKIVAFGELVKEKTNSSIEIEVFDSAALGTQRDALEGMLVGTVNGTVSLEPLSYWVKDINLDPLHILLEHQGKLRATFLFILLKI